jgi:TolB-like protein/class 3 adenylate cyclase/Flp pilus assembly protein TadD
MAAEVKKEIALEIAHVLFIDIVGYSKLSINDQNAAVEELNQVVRGSEQFQKAEAAGRLLKIATGDGMALVFYTSPEAPAECAVEISHARKDHPRLQLRMGIHSGPVSGVIDVNNRPNLAGAGLNMAQRVMGCGDAGHILLSKHVAEDLEEYDRWRPLLHELGTCEVKHGMRVSMVSLYADQVGNPQLPKKFQALKKRSARMRWAVATTVVLALAAIVAGVAIFSHYRVRPTLAAPEKSIAVLPLENLSKDEENAYFANGIQDELLSNLAKIKDLKVISRTSVMQYKAGITRNLKEIAQQLGVSNVVEGSVRRSGNHVRVSVQLIDALTDHHIWVQNYDRTLADSLTQQGELATEIAAAVGASLSPQEKARVEATPTKNAAAYDAYLRGRAFAMGSSKDMSEIEGAIRSYQEAVKLDPNFVLAWAYLSSVQSGAYWFDPTAARLAAAKEALDRAIALDPNLPETHLALGYYRYYGQFDFAGALAEFQLAEQGFPNNADIVRAIALIHRRFGHWDETIATVRRLVELDPRNTASASILGFTYMSVRHFSDALATADHILAVEPGNADAIWIKLYSFWATGNLEAADALVANPNADPWLRGQDALIKRRYSEAADILAKVLNDKPDEEKDIFIALGLAQQRAGNVEGAKATYQHAAQELRRQLGNAAPDFPNADLHSNLGIAYAGLGDAVSAVAEGRKGIALQPSSEDPFQGPEREEAMARIYALLGDADHAIPILKRLIQISSPTEITPGLLRLNPIWDPIRNDPRFQELVAEKQP